MVLDDFSFSFLYRGLGTAVLEQPKYSNDPSRRTYTVCTRYQILTLLNANKVNIVSLYLRRLFNHSSAATLWVHRSVGKAGIERARPVIARVAMVIAPKLPDGCSSILLPIFAEYCFRNDYHLPRDHQFPEHMMIRGWRDDDTLVATLHIYRRAAERI